MKVLILSGNTGGGHNAAARAVQQALQARGDEACLRDLLAMNSEKLSQGISQGYVSIVNKAPVMFQYLYKAGQAISRPWLRSPVYFMNLAFVGAMRRELEAGRYDAVVTSHLFAAQTLTALRRRGELDIPSVAIATDYTCIPFWEETRCDFCVVGHRDLISEFTAKGIPAQKILPYGIPVSGECMAAKTKSQARAALKLPLQQPVVLLLSGSMGHGDQRALLHKLRADKKKRPYLVVVCGSNEEMRRELEHHFCRQKDVRVLGYEKNVPDYLAACDVVVTKPGGLSSTEAAVVGAPTVFCNAIPGCETYNQEFFVKRGMAYAPDSLWAQARAVLLLAESEAYRQKMQRAQRENIPPDAADKICQLLHVLDAQRKESQ